MFDRKVLEGRQFIEAYRSGGVTSLITENANEMSETLRTVSLRNSRLGAEMLLWLDRYQAEYARGTMEQVLAQAIISNWIGKILFAHILREKDQRAQRYPDIDENTSPVEALTIFKKIS